MSSERQKEYQRRHYKKTRLERIAQVKEWQKNNPERYKELCARYRAKIAKVNTDLTPELKEAVKAIAKAEGKSVSVWIKELIEDRLGMAKPKMADNVPCDCNNCREMWEAMLKELERQKADPDFELEPDDCHPTDS